jgi:hypothetical protein
MEGTYISQCPFNILPIPIPMKRIKGKIKCGAELL